MALKNFIVQAIVATDADTKKTEMPFRKDYNMCDCIRMLAWAWGDGIRKCIHETWKKTFSCASYFKVLSKNLAELLNNLKLDMK